MKRFVIISFLLYLNAFGYSQHGYLGQMFSLEPQIHYSPSFRGTYTFKPDDNIIQRSHRYAYLNYGLKLNITLNRRLELSGGYSFSRVRTWSHGARIDVEEEYTLIQNPNPQTILRRYNILHDPKLTFHRYSGDIKLYRLGSQAPSGKYIGIGFITGRLSNEADGNIIYGKKEAAHIYTPFIRRYELREIDTIQARGVEVRSFQLNVKVGRNYPIHKFLSLSICVTIPTIDLYRTDEEWKIRGFRDYQRYYSHNFEGNNFDKLYIWTARKYNFISLDLGLRLHF